MSFRKKPRWPLAKQARWAFWKPRDGGDSRPFTDPPKESELEDYVLLSITNDGHGRVREPTKKDLRRARQARATL